MRFTKEMTERLQKLFNEKVSSLLQTYYGRVHEVERDWHLRLKQMGVFVISQEDLVGDCEKFSGMVLLENTRLIRGLSYIMVPVETAEKILFLESLP